ncbi:hypothetical protein KPL70_004937 [Citrus sinensis]|uniref:Uncharacterized protein n=1 Tax=Citrus sinensis TaxID=2711 RepID=A0ACB8NEP0_CITSI|nr:hypothetical protein KPL70_004937 [Citrus sinensis]KAH9796470.1 hypothetical protein KPL71_005541 [Citrus sinensis]
MEIGYPTDVKHVAHIGWDGQSGSAPSWNKELKILFSKNRQSLAVLSRDNILISQEGIYEAYGLLTIDIFGGPFKKYVWENVIESVVEHFEQQMGQQPASELFKDILPTDLPKIPKKQKRKKKSSNNSPKSSSSSSRSSRAAKTKATYSEMEKSNIQM